MIAVDGDSVAMVTETGVPIKHKWPQMLSETRGQPVETFAHAQATARDCALRIWRIAARRPKWYVLMIGQWSQNHEPLAWFDRYVRICIEEMLMRGVQVAIVTPPAEVTDLIPYLAAA
jgi:hypothetical protein